MANPTARALIIDAFQTSGIRGLGQQVTNEDTAVGLNLIPLLRLQRLWAPCVTEYTFTTANSIDRYSVGFADPVPTNPQPDVVVNQEIVQILQGQANISNVWVPLRQTSPEDYYRMTRNDTVTIIPSQFMYNRTRNPFDELVFSSPTLAGYEVRLAVNGEVQTYNLDDTIDLPSGMYVGLLYGLAELIADAYGLTEKAMSLNSKFASALMRIKDVTGAPVPKLKLDYGRTRYDITSDVTVNSSGGI